METSLSEFIATTINEILKGVESTNTTSGELGYDEAGVVAKHGGTGKNDTLVDFDLAVTSSSTKTKEGTASINVLNVFNLGGEKDSQILSENVSRIKFTLPVSLPVDAYRKSQLKQLKRGQK